ncbi:M20 family metallopeptidase [Nocardia sp. NPDC059246]|uniref:M20 metallopeptidase family protein n=1 Tax=unclassified Nocardia TaxID=2637762 RepID=UPI00367607B3
MTTRTDMQASSLSSIAALVEAMHDKKAQDQVRLHRRELHQIPEIAYREYRTAEYVERCLQGLGLDVTRPTETSVLGTLRTGRVGPTLVIRADMDALPISEDTGLPYASANGHMHACGHDGHMASVLTVAEIISKCADEFHGEFRFLFQHAEEPLPSGAPDIVAAGVLSGADMVVGHHLSTPLQLGVVSAARGPLMAACDYFEITVVGGGGHGAMPHQSTDPISIGSQIVGNLQHIVAREVSALDSAVLSVTGFDGGTEYNVCPSTVVLRGTIRSFDDDVRGLLARRLEEIAVGIAKAHRAEAQVKMIYGSPPVNNDDHLADIVAQALTDLQLETPAEGRRKSTGGEDFAWYQREVPGVFFLVGATASGADVVPHHHPKFDFDERAMDNAVKLFIYFVQSTMRRSPIEAGASA